MSPEQQAVMKWLQERAKRGYEAGSGGDHACACVGAREGEPLCLCRMYYAVQVDGAWYEINRTYVPWGEDIHATLIPPSGHQRDGTPYYGRKWTADVDLINMGADWITVIKIIRADLNLTLEEAATIRNAARNGPITLLKGVHENVAYTLVTKLEAAGATVKMV